jgi:uncharacterized membrane protein YhfC
LIAAAIALPGPTRWPCLSLAGLMGAGTLLALERFHSGATQRAAVTLVTAWALIMAVTGEWLLPSAEPHRSSTLVAERLAALAVKYRAQPMLGTYQEPSVIYLLGHPVPILHGLFDLHVRVYQEGPVISALSAEEVATIRSDSALEVEIPETLRVVNLSKGQSSTLQLALITPRRPGSGGLAGPAQQTLVK